MVSTIIINWDFPRNISEKTKNTLKTTGMDIVQKSIAVGMVLKTTKGKFSFSIDGSLFCRGEWIYREVDEG